MIPDGVKKVWNDVNKLYDKIPNSVKFTIGAVGVAAAVVTGAAPLGAAVGVLAGAMLGGAAMNAGIYAAGAFFGYHDFSWKEMGKTALDGAADGALFAGVGMIAKSVTYAVKNPEPLKAFLADETGCLDLSGAGTKGGKRITCDRKYNPKEPMSPSNYPPTDPNYDVPPVRYEPKSIDEVERMRKGKGPTTKASVGDRNIEAHHRKQKSVEKGGIIDDLEEYTHRRGGNHKRHSEPSELTPKQRAKEISNYWKKRGAEYILPGEGI